MENIKNGEKVKIRKLRKTMKIFIQNSKQPSQDLNQVHYSYRDQ